MKAQLLVAASLAAMAWPTIANAQDVTEVDQADQIDTAAKRGGVEEIVVTAQRRSERLQDVPISVTAVTAARLAATGVSDTQDLTVVTPGLTAPQTQGYAQPHIRGVGATTNGPGLEQPVATYIDGVYIAAAPTALLSLNNIERIEVLKGPQGTLFGRNATGGLIHVITRDPAAEPRMAFNVTYGRFENVIGDAYIGSGLTDSISADLSLRYETQQEGWGTNLANGDGVGELPHDFASRIKFLIEPGANTQIRLAADYENRASRRSVAKLIYDYPSKLPYNDLVYGPFEQGGKYDTNRDTTGLTTLDGGGVSMQVDHDFGAIALRSITAYRDTRSSLLIDTDGIPLPLTTIDGDAVEKQFSQELQLSSSGNSPLTWVAGLFYFDATAQYDTIDINRLSSGLQISIFDEQKSKAMAAYAQATYEVLPGTSITLGGRYNHETKSLNGTQKVFFPASGTVLAETALPDPALGFPDEIKFNRFNYRIAIDQKITPEIMAYVSYNTGFKSGGYNLNNPANAPYLPEDIKAFEAGIKSQLFDNMLRLNVAGYYYDYKNIQVGRYANNQLTVYNGPGAKVYGADLDFELALSSQFSMFGGLAYNHSEFTNFPNADYIAPCGGFAEVPPTEVLTCSATGNALPYAPRFTYNLGANYHVDVPIGRLGANVNWYHTSKFYVGADNVVSQSPYGLLNASVSWTEPSDHFTVRLWGKNLTNSYYFQAATETNSSIGIYTAAPVTYGISLGYEY